MGIIGFYFSLYLLAKLIPSKKKVAAPEAAHASTSAGEIPSIDSPEFAAWISADGSIEKLLA